MALDREENTITVTGDLPTGRSAPRWVRIYNSGRSSMYEVISSRRSDDGRDTVLRLKETALLGRGIPVGYQEGRIDNDVCLPFATGRVDEEGNLFDFPCRFAGARVESADGSASLLLRGINGSGWVKGEADYDLYLEEPLAAAKLQELFGPADDPARFVIYDYGVGDNYEAALCQAGG